MSNKKTATTSGILIVILLLTLFFSACAQSPAGQSSTPVSKPPSAATPIVLNSIWASSTMQPDFPVCQRYMNLINERSKGELVIKYKGGGEIMPYEEMAEATRKGVFDHAILSSGLLASSAPEANSTALSYTMTPAQIRESGFFSLLQEVYREKAKLYYLAHMGYNNDFLTGLTKKRISTPREFKGMAFLSTPFFKAFIEGLGATPVNIAREETYDALQRGMVDAYCKPVAAIWDEKFYEATKYIIDHAAFSGGPVISVMNPVTWNRLPQHLKDIVNEVSLEMETWATKYFDDKRTTARDKIKGVGIEFIKFTPEDQKLYMNVAYTKQWDDILRKSPDYGTRLKAIMDKFVK